MKNTKGYKIYNFIMKIISWCVMSILVVVGALLLTIVVLNKIADAKGELSPMGLYTIISPSMTPDIDVYDVVFVVRKDPKDIEIGDIVSYYSTISTIGDIPVTHRVVEKFNTNTGVSFRTKGDANQVVDNEIVMGERVIGTVRFVIPFLGRIQFFLASKGGWFIAILIPALGIITYDIVKLVKLISVKNKMKPDNKTKKENKNLVRNKESLNKRENLRIRRYKDDFDDYYIDEQEDSRQSKRIDFDEYLEEQRKNKIKSKKEYRTYDDDYEYTKRPVVNKKRKISYEEELNSLVDKLSEENERELYTKKQSNYYKRSSRK